ncbi:amidohydrolase family protein [Halogeometricum limi]|uniref:Predicted metal-dependent hydrolase, TIM-barrel fold n=1 Tax=Halogeometricum limi TaxID=555875 RepID=A0A1I6ICE6_9EURY|nr:amidohydrolase family protein [Halogeometricum limi]SFR64356.1 Predicted metal-dependent hydrolase, TIM-barrel fold [Halogeometricum limi]
MPYTARADREFPIIDFGAHLVTDVPEFMEPLDDRIGPVHTDPEATIDRYKNAGIDRLVLSQPPFMGSTDVERTRNANDDLMDIVEGDDDLYGLAALPVGASGGEAADELERCLDRGYNGGALETMSNGTKLTDEEVRPVLEVADREGAPLLVHPKIDVSLHPEVDVLDDKYRLNAVFGREAALSQSILEVVHMGILDDYPDLNLVFHHLGGNIASMMGRVHLHHILGRWPGQEHIESFDDFKQKLESRVFVDTSGFYGYHAPIRTTLEEFPSSQVLFGTDAPYEARDADELSRFATTVLDVASDTDSEAVLSGNALRLLANVD